MEHAPDSPLTRRRLAGLLLAAAQTPLGSTMIAIALPRLAVDMQADAATLTLLLVSSYLVVGIVLQSPGGRLGDMFGHPRMVAAGQILFALGAICGTVAWNTPMLTAARIMMAAGGALVVPAAIAMLRLHVAPERRARVFGQVGAVMGLAAALGPTLGGALLAGFGWRAIFFVSLPLLGLAALLQTGLAREAKAARARLGPSARGFDWVGTVLQALAITAIVAGVTVPVPGIAGALVAGGALLLAAFVAFELRTAAPVVDPRLFASRSYAAGTSIVGLQNLAMYGLLFQLPHLYEKLRGVDAAALGPVLFAMMGSMVVGAPLGGRVSERIGVRLTALAGALITVAGVALLHNVDGLITPADALPGLVLLGLGIGLTTAPSQAAAMSGVRAEQAGMGAGVMSTMRYLGGVAGIALLGVLLAGEAMRNAESHRVVLSVYAGALIGSAALALLLPGRVKRARPSN